jgi:hypothetical protein
MFKRKRCCECKGTFDLLQWLGGTHTAYVCRQCAAKLRYYDYMTSIAEWLQEGQ